MITDPLTNEVCSKFRPGDRATVAQPDTHLSQVLVRFGISTNEAVVVVCTALLFLLEIGIKNGELNQVFYLLRGLRLANPSLLARDWYTADSVPYHLWWNVLIGLLAKANLLVFGLTLGTVIVSIAFTVSVYVVMKTLYAQPVLPCVVALMLFGGLFTRGLGDWDLLASSVEPFSTSGVVFVCGLAFLAKRNRWEPAYAWDSVHFCILILRYFLRECCWFRRFLCTWSRAGGFSPWLRFLLCFLLHRLSGRFIRSPQRQVETRLFES